MRFYVALVLLFSTLSISAQQSPVQKFGRIQAADLQKKVYAIDSSADAVVLFDVGSAEIEGNRKGWFSIVYRHHKRIHILNKNGYDHANVSITLYNSNGMEVDLDNIKAVTYNLEDGKLVETKLEKSAVLKEKIDKEYSRRKFTLPNVKEGSIIEYEYRITSDFIQNVRPWSFQGAAPCLWSEYSFSVPQFLNYTFLAQGYQRMHLNEKKDRITNFNISESGGTGPTQNYSFSSGVTDHRWVMKDVPALKVESFTSTLENHLSRIEFQLASFQRPLTPKDIMGSWPLLTQSLLENEYFGASLKSNNAWLGDVVKPLMAAAGSDLEKARNIYAWVRDNITCADHSSVYMDKGLREVLKTKKGNVAEVNLLLTAMLKYAGINADPVILSTSENGFAYPLYPLLRRFNYVISKVTVDNNEYLLDASHPRLGFGKLAANCYNGHARVVNAAATPMNLSADSLLERKLTSVFVANTENGSWVASARQNNGYFESYNIREKIKEKGKETFFKDLQKGLGNDIQVTNTEVDSLDRYDIPLALKYSFAINKENEDLLYINPMFGEGYKDNPFKSAERLYPVEMPYTIDETYVMTMQVPAGYEVDELPKQIAVKLNEDGDGYFEYLISRSENTISLRSRLKIGRTVFSSEEYDFLREFFMLIVSKHNEQIVFKKKAKP